MTKDQFEKLPKVRVFSSVGPCLTFYRFVKENKKTVTVAYWNYDHVAFERKPKSWVHFEPCRNCEDHPKTQYPYGYMD